MGQITIDYQSVEQKCDHCGEAFGVTRGSAYDEGEGFCIYLAGLHNCHSGKLAHTAIAVREGYEGFEETCVVCLHIWVDESDFRMSVIDPDQSPWKNETYLGRIMTRDEALEHPFISTFFHIADHIVISNPKINEYFDDFG